MRLYQASALESFGDRGMVLLASAPRFRSHLLRFIDALAGLSGDRNGRQTKRLLREYLAGDFVDLPPPLRPFVRLATADVWPPPLVAVLARRAVRKVAARFIADSGSQDALQALEYLRRHGRMHSFDILGEYVASEPEADRYCDQYLELLSALAQSPMAGRETAGRAYMLQVSLKLSSLTAGFNPVDPAGTILRLRPRLSAIVPSATAHGIGVTLDMERYETRDLTLRTFFEVFGKGALASDTLPHGRRHLARVGRHGLAGSGLRAARGPFAWHGIPCSKNSRELLSGGVFLHSRSGESVGDLLEPPRPAPLKDASVRGTRP